MVFTPNFQGSQLLSNNTLNLQPATSSVGMGSRRNSRPTVRPLYRKGPHTYYVC